MRIDTCADVNIMPKGVYQTLFKDPRLRKIHRTKIRVSTYNDSTLELLGQCILYFPHPETKQMVQTTFYITKDEGSILMSCATTLDLKLISIRPRLNEVPEDFIIYTSTLDTPQQTNMYTVNMLSAGEHDWKLEEPAGRPGEVLEPTSEQSDQSGMLKELVTAAKQITSKEVIKKHYPSVFEGIGKFPGDPY